MLNAKYCFAEVKDFYINLSKLSSQWAASSKNIPTRLPIALMVVSGKTNILKLKHVKLKSIK